MNAREFYKQEYIKGLIKAEEILQKHMREKWENIKINEKHDDIEFYKGIADARIQITKKIKEEWQKWEQDAQKQQ